MYAELLTPSLFTATTFPNDGAYDELVVARDIPLHSLCEHHDVFSDHTTSAAGKTAGAPVANES